MAYSIKVTDMNGCGATYTRRTRDEVKVLVDRLLDHGRKYIGTASAEIIIKSGK